MRGKKYELKEKCANALYVYGGQCVVLCANGAASNYIIHWADGVAKDAYAEFVYIFYLFFDESNNALSLIKQR